jgi:iron complex outermembrane recepter protein
MVERMPPRGTNASQASTSLKWAALACISISGLSGEPVCAAANLDRTVDFHIPAQPLDTALLEFSKQAQIQVMVNSGSLRKMTAPNVTGQMAVSDALSELLGHTGLQYGTVGNTVTVAPHAPNSTAAEPLSAAEAQSANSPSEPRRSPPSTGVASSGQQASSGGRDPGQLDEVLVSAEKRSERLQDVPVPVTAISADVLLNSNQTRLQDYYSSVPGFSVAPAAVQGAQVLSIRGITTGSGTNPTVGITVDDVPYGSSTNLGGGSVVPDIDPSDLARIEVLRGPQGTLYGASSMGGLLKFVTVDPSTEALTGRLEAGTSSVHNGEELGYSFRGSVNIPLTETLAIRATGFTRQDPGYIDNPVLHINGVNEDHVSGGRLAAMWRPADTFSLKLSALYQKSTGDGGSDVDKPVNGYSGPVLGDLQQNYVRGVGNYDRTVQVYSATLNGKLGIVDVTSLTGYNINSYVDSWDYSFALGGSTQAAYGVGGAPVFDNNKTKKFTQEVRLTAPLGPSFEWLLGGFYTHESTVDEEDVSAADPVSGATVASNVFTINFPTRYSESAAFTNLTYHISDRFDVQIGARESHINQTGSQTETLALFGAPDPIISPPVDSSSNAFTYLLTPRFKVSPDVMVYARFASGYRAGGPNLTSGMGTPAQYNPDKTQNYELGIKGDFLDHLLALDASAYYIQWKDIQLQLLNPDTQLDYNTNGNRAKSQGIEISVQAKPLTGLSLSAWVVWNDAELTEAFPPNTTAYGVAGNRLPYTSRFSGNFSVSEAFPLGPEVMGSVGGDLSYVGDRTGVFTPQASPTDIPARQDLPAYTKVDLHAGANYGSWMLNVFVANVFDERGIISGGTGEVPPFAFINIQPRTVGLTVSKTF